MRGINHTFLINIIMKQYILCAAIWFDDGIERIHQPKNIKTGIVICGRRHHNCFNIPSELLGNKLKTNKTVQGFITSDDLFVDRTEAAVIALRAGQIEKEVTKLFSEDLY